MALQLFCFNGVGWHRAGFLWGVPVQEGTLESTHHPSFPRRPILLPRALLEHW